MKIQIPKTTIFGKPIEGSIERVFSKQAQTQQQPSTQAQSREGMIYVPESQVYFAKQRSHLNEDWNKTHQSLASKGLRMPTIEEFRRALKYFKDSGDNELITLYNDITEARTPWRASWLDADFKVVNNVLHINYNHRVQNNILIPRNSEPLANDTLMENKSEISLEDWLTNTTTQGLPKQTIGGKGSFYYWAPLKDNNSVARFDAYSYGAALNCYRDPSGRNSNLGVFAVAEAGSQAR